MDFISRTDVSFLLHDWLKVGALTERSEFSDHSKETFDLILDLAADLARDSFAPHYKASDIHEPQFDGKQVTLLPEIADALDEYAGAGFFGSDFSESLGGVQLPMVVSTAAFSHFCAANLATAGYPMLTAANARLLVEHASEAQIDTWARPQIEGRYFGTMCLSEPHAGSSLADIRTKATADGSDRFGARFRISGNKMWISGGDHEMSENIIHLVLARITDSDGSMLSGSGGISLFLVPRVLPDGTRNDVAVAGLNHKMGYRGTVNCLLNFGEKAGAQGWLVGEPGQGLAIMFQMMNEARIMVGLGAASLAYRGFTQSLDYARERPQGRSAGRSRDADSPQIAIVEHSDVKRMLMAQKAFAEGSLALVLYAARLSDEARTAPEDDQRVEARQLLDLLTPIAKSWPSEFGLVANDHAIQVHGGYGYTREYDVEQIYRDNRLNPIHEGTFGIQAIDFVGRKLLRDDGRGFAVLRQKIRKTIAQAAAIPQLSGFANDLDTQLEDATDALNELLVLKQHPGVLDNAGLALTAYGHLVVAWIWLDQTTCAIERGQEACDFAASKFATCRYFFEFELPKIAHQLALVRGMSDAASSVPSDLFSFGDA